MKSKLNIKLNRRYYSITALGCFVLLAIGCSKKEMPNRENIKVDEVLEIGNNELRSSISYSNTNNPGDSIGKTHNILVDSMLTFSYDIEDTAETESIIIGRIEDWAFLAYGQSIDISILQNVPNYGGNYSAVNYTNYESIINDLNDLNSTQKQILISYIDDVTSINLSGKTIHQIRASVIQIENDYIDNLGGDFDLFYASSSIYRYSLLRTIDNEYPEEPLIHNIKPWVWIAMGDILGAALGGAAGGIGGALSGASAGSAIADLFVG